MRNRGWAARRMDNGMVNLILYGTACFMRIVLTDKITVCLQKM